MGETGGSKVAPLRGKENILEWARTTNLRLRSQLRGAPKIPEKPESYCSLSLLAAFASTRSRLTELTRYLSILEMNPVVYR